MCSERVHNVFKLGSDLVQIGFRLSSECDQNVFRLRSDCVQNVFKMCSDCFFLSRGPSLKNFSLLYKAKLVILNFVLVLDRENIYSRSCTNFNPDQIE